MFFPWPVIFDCKNLLSRFKKPFKPSEISNPDYTIIVPIFKNPRFLKNLDYLKRFREKVMLCTIDDPENTEMMAFLTQLRAEGFRIIELREFKGVDTKYYLIKKSFEIQIYDALRRKGVSIPETKYVCLLDGDTTPEDDIGKVCAVIDENNLDIASVRVVPSASSNFIEKMQKIEYNIAMLARHYYPWLTSGACTIGRTNVIKEIMERHSLFFWGGDIEVGVMGREMKKRIGHTDFKVYTEVPNSFRSWFKQRIGWFCGQFRIATINWDKHLKHPLFLLYSCGLVFLMWPVKWIISLTCWWALPLSIFLYIPITLLVNWQVRDKYMVLFPLYAAFQIFVLPIFGFLKYLQLLLKYRINGRIARR